jgi:trafficking protein particle complex subunit 3
MIEISRFPPIVPTTTARYIADSAMKPAAPTVVPQTLRAGDIAFARMEKINAELVAMTYGALVAQVFEDHNNDVLAINKELELIGRNMGVRMIDEFLAKQGVVQTCSTFKDAVEVLARIAMKMFLGIDAEVVQISERQFLINFPENPLNDFVEIPNELRESEFRYCSIYCGLIRGAFEMLRMQVECAFVSDVLRGDSINSIQVELVSVIRDDEED